MKVAIVRGEYLTKWEMQCYEPLAERLNVTAFASSRTLYPIDSLQLPVRRLPGIDPYVNRSPILSKTVGRSLGLHIGRDYLIGLERALADFDISHTLETFLGFTFQAAQAQKRYGAKLVSTCWETIPFLHEEEPPMRRMKRYVQRRADIFLAPTRRAAERP